MKHVRLYVGAAVLMTVAGCATTGDDEGQAGAAVMNGNDGLVALSAETAAEVKATAGLDATRGRPIYEPGLDTPAYFEIATAAGWAVVTASSPAHVVEYGTTGRSPSARLELGVQNVMRRVYRLDPAVYVAADDMGNALGRTTKGLVKIDRSGAQARFVPISSDDAIRGWRAARNELLAAEAKNAIATRTTADSPLIGGTPPEKTCIVPGDVPSYEQLSPGEGPNTTACMSGCGPTAWATIFGWASRRAQAAPTEAGGFAGLFPNAPLRNDAAVGELSMKINDIVGTMCFDGQGATTPWGMSYVSSLVSERAPGVTIDAHYNFLMTPDNVNRDAAIAALCDGRPTIVGIGSLFGGDGHYPIAKAYSNGRFELEMGWGGDGNGWYDAKTWYSGTVAH